MKYLLRSGREINIDDEEIRANMEGLKVTKEEAIKIYLEDEGYEINEEQEQLDEKAKAVKIKHGAGDKQRRARKTVERKPDEDKEMIIAEIAKMLANIEGAAAIKVENVGKIVTFAYNDNEYKIDLVKKRKAK